MRSSPADALPGVAADTVRHLWAVVLAGGIGSRFWPASTPSQPKQLLPLASEQPLIRDTIERILPLVPQERLRILTGGSLADPILSAVPELGPGNLLLEPRAAGTAPVLAWAAAEIERRDPDAVMISLHADHIISPAPAFRDRLALTAHLAASHRRLFTLGVPPTRPETGYGYVRVGAPLPALDSLPETGFEVASFVEKPSLETARLYLQHGDYLWNSGLFVWRVADLLDQLERHTPELAELIPLLREGGTEQFFDGVPHLSIDQGLLERSDRVAVMPANFDWDDVGAWDALFRSRPLDDEGNAIVGEVHAVDTRGSVLYADDGPIVAFGADDLVIVRTAGITFVAPRSRVPDMKDLLESLPERIRRLD
jgi:mannose-1-phosphate guanylyltransferase